MMCRGAIVDAARMHALSSAKNAEKKRDPSLT